MIFTHARPFAPRPWANSVRTSRSFLDRSAISFALMALTTPPVFATVLNTLRPHFAPMSVISFNSMPKRVSGLSVPNLSMASL